MSRQAEYPLAGLLRVVISELCLSRRVSVG
jgi:hypothetical protein